MDDYTPSRVSSPPRRAQILIIKMQFSRALIPHHARKLLAPITATPTSPSPPPPLYPTLFMTFTILSTKHSSNPLPFRKKEGYQSIKMEMVKSCVAQFLYPPPPSLFVTAMSVVSFASLANAGFSEMKGKHLQYSKFWNVKTPSSTPKKDEVKLSSRTGMLILYTPAFLAALFSLGLFSNDESRFLLVDSALTLHFFKRVIEVLFVHRYSGGMILDSVIPISLSYTLSTATMIYNQHLTHGLPEPQVDLQYAGLALFLLGTCGNFYHHTILARLREKDDKGYKIPRGGMFDLVLCPHYLFEILAFVGISLISQTVYPLCFTIGTILYLLGRSYATRKWYLSKFPNFPKDIKRIIPFIF